MELRQRGNAWQHPGTFDAFVHTLQAVLTVVFATFIVCLPATVR
jgi:hypothetical protein